MGFAALLLLAAVVLIVRRATGALSAPLPALQLVTTAVVVAAWAWTVRSLWRRWIPADATSPSVADHIAGWLPPVSLLLFAVACSWPGGRWIDWLVWLPIIAIDWFGPWTWPAPASDSLPAVEEAVTPAVPGEVVAEDQVLQQLTRVRRPDGSEMVQGRLAAQFAPGARVVTLHAAFCPPFARLPQVEAEVADGPDLTVRIVQVLASGVRIDVQLERAADRAQCATVEIVAIEGDVS